MGIEAFPEIENFQKLPRQVIVKGGDSSADPVEGAKLHGIVINNIGHSIRAVRVNIVILDEAGIPVLNTSTTADPDSLPQGAIGSFTFKIPDYHKTIDQYHLYANWRFDDRE